MTTEPPETATRGGDAPSPEESLPVIGILRNAKVPGMSNPEDVVQPMTFMRLDQAVENEWPSDAHFVLYRLVNDLGETGEHPRLNKPMLAKARSQGGDILVHSLALDLDTPGHVTWTEELFAQFLDAWTEAVGVFPIIGDATLFYTTTGGCRFVYVLSKPIPADIAEGKIRWLVQEFQRAGLAVDSLCDWTRLFRLPKVTRQMRATDVGSPIKEELNDVRTSTLPSAAMSFQWHKRLNPDLLPEVIERARITEYAEIKPVIAPKPDPSYCESLLLVASNRGGFKDSDFTKAAKQRLKGRECYPCLFEHAPMAAPGHRDQTLHRYVGQAISMICDLPGVSPQHIYALFLHPACQFDPDHETPDWSEKLWDVVKRLWAKEQAKLDFEKVKVQGNDRRRDEILNRMVDGMREWCKAPELHQDDEAAKAFVSRHAIATAGNVHFVLNPNGRYSNLPLNDGQLIPYIRKNGLEDLMPTRRMVERSIVDLSPVAIRNDFSFAVEASVELEPEIGGGYVRNINTTDTFTDPPRLVLPCYRRNPALTASYSPEVDQWLRHFFGQDYENGCRWLSWALAFDVRETCALSLVGSPGAGKKLFVQGLAETLERPELASADSMIGNFQYGLMKSPYICVNEGWPRTAVKHPADAFRSIVSGDETAINLKFMPPLRLRSYPRVILTANNYDIVMKLASGMNLSNEDREALSHRLMHINVGAKASTFLQSRGGYAFTARPGHKWVADKSGHSDFILARHFLWLYEQRGVQPSTRFLCEGNASEAVLFSLQTQSGQIPLVIETIMAMLSHAQPKSLGLKIEQGRLLVKISDIVSYFRTYMTLGIRQELTTNTVRDCLKTLAEPATPDNDAETKTQWWSLNIELLQQVAHRDGWKTEALDQIQEQIKETRPSYAAA
jgi:hypothetical protein